MPDLLGGGVHEHVAVLGRPAAVPPLEEVGHHDADLAPLASEELLHLPGEDGVWVVGLGVVLELLGVEEHLCSFPSDRPRRWGALLASTTTSTVVPLTAAGKRPMLDGDASAHASRTLPALYSTKCQERS